MPQSAGRQVTAALPGHQAGLCERHAAWPGVSSPKVPVGHAPGRCLAIIATPGKDRHLNTCPPFSAVRRASNQVTVTQILAGSGSVAVRSAEAREQAGLTGIGRQAGIELGGQGRIAEQIGGQARECLPLSLPCKEGGESGNCRGPSRIPINKTVNYRPFFNLNNHSSARVIERSLAAGSSSSARAEFTAIDRLQDKPPPVESASDRLLFLSEPLTTFPANLIRVGER